MSLGEFLEAFEWKYCIKQDKLDYRNNPVN